MAQTAIQTTYTATKVIPKYRPDLVSVIPVNLAPSTVYPAGQILGQTASAANDVQTIADTGTVSGGTFTISGTNPITGVTFTTAAIAFNAAISAVKTAIEAVIGGGVTVTMGGGVLPGTDTTITFGGTAVGMPVPLMTIDSALLTGVSPVLAIAHTTTGRSLATFAKYVDGTNTATLILEYACATDADGLVTHGAVAAAGGLPYASAFQGGYFDCADLTGLDAAGVVDMNGLITVGTVSVGTFKF